MADGSVIIDTELDNKGVEKGLDKLKGGFSKIKNIASTALKGIAVGATAVATGIALIGKQAIDSFADYEQLIGGVETLFKDSAGIVEGYANNAYKTAGLSANQYMETVTSFSASLLQSLNGDTKKAAEVADMAITDMSDNANKMGTSMESIQVAYQGFAKQNYTMLDNLKLGYGGTKEEMQRLLKDAEKISGIKYDISNLNDVYQAIHVIQGELDITGTTAKEASTTIQGSTAAMKAAWQNLLTGLSDDTMDFDKLLDNFINSVVTLAENLIPRIQTTIEGIGIFISALLQDVLPKIIDGIPDILEETLPIILNALQFMISSIIEVIPSLIQVFIDLIPQIVTAILVSLPMLIDAGIKIILNLIIGLGQALPQILISIVQVINQIVGTIIDNIPLILDAAIQFFMAIVDSIPIIIEALVANVAEIINTVVYGLVNALPQIIDSAITMLMGIVEAIPTIIDSLIENLPYIIETILEAFIDNFPKILDGAIQLLMALIDAIPIIILALVDNLPKIINTIVNTLIDNLPLLIKAAVQLFMGIIKAIPKIIIEIGKNMPQIISAIVKGIKQGFSSIVEAGSNLIKGLWQGISNVKDWIWGKIKGFCKGIVDNIKGFFGIHSPSKLFNKEIGQNLGFGLGEGFNDSLKSVYKKMQKGIETENAKLTNNLTTQHQIQVNNEDDKKEALNSMEFVVENRNTSILQVDGKDLATNVNKHNRIHKLQYGY